ncbi:hypothetical protein D3C71_1617140 [compost metagenome]
MASVEISAFAIPRAHPVKRARPGVAAEHRGGRDNRLDEPPVPCVQIDATRCFELPVGGNQPGPLPLPVGPVLAFRTVAIECGDQHLVAALLGGLRKNARHARVGLERLSFFNAQFRQQAIHGQKFRYARLGLDNAIELVPELDIVFPAQG